MALRFDSLGSLSLLALGAIVFTGCGDDAVLAREDTGGGTTTTSATTSAGGAGQGGAGAGGCAAPLPPATSPGCDSIAPQPEPGLVAYWPIENEPGQVACDLSGNGHHGEREGAAEFSGAGRGAGGWSLSLVNNGGLRVHAGPEFDLSPAATISFWLRLQSPGFGSFLVSRGAPPGSLFNLGVNPGLDLQLYSRDSSGNDSDSRSPGSLVPLDTWTHLAVVIDAPGGQRVYRDGTLVYTATKPVATRNFCGDLLVGKSDATSTELSARLDDFKWWNIALTPEKICQEAGGTFSNQGCKLAPAAP